MIQGIFRVIFTLTYNALLEMNLFTPRASRYSTIPYDSIVEYASKAPDHGGTDGGFQLLSVQWSFFQD